MILLAQIIQWEKTLDWTKAPSKLAFVCLKFHQLLLSKVYLLINSFSPFSSAKTGCHSGPDPGFSVGGKWTHFGGFWPPTWALFSENVCENERIGSCRGRIPVRPPLDPPMPLQKLMTFVVLQWSTSHSKLKPHTSTTPQSGSQQIISQSPWYCEKIITIRGARIMVSWEILEQSTYG